MPSPNLSGSESYGVRSRRLLLIAAFLLTPVPSARAQEHDDDRDHDHLHFSHPLVTESPSPDTKVRIDYLGARTSGSTGIHENVFRLEGEYAFNHAVSFAIVTPFIWRTAPAAERASGLGNIELSLKGASLAFAERGFLLGGGLSAALPTGSDAKGIGSAHIVELEPFFDAAYKRGPLELVGFSTVSSNFRRRAGEEAERNLTLDFSGLYQIHPRLEGLLELTTTRPLIGDVSGIQEAFIAPGFKVYPFANRKLMFGVSVEIGTGLTRDTNALLLSGFYHF